MRYTAYDAAGTFNTVSWVPYGWITMRGVDWTAECLARVRRMAEGKECEPGCLGLWMHRPAVRAIRRRAAK
jgi:hypothetical protein